MEQRNWRKLCAALLLFAALTIVTWSCDVFHRPPDTPPAGGGSEEFSTSVSARTCAWQSAGVVVSVGDTVTLHASGQVVHWRSQDGTQKEYCGPEGSGQGACDDPGQSCCLAPGLPNNSLVGRIGEGAAFYVGPNKTVVASASGTLYLGMNETAHCGGCADNEGSWSVEIGITH